MKALFFLILMFFIVNITLGEEKVRQIKWERVVGLQYQGFNAYVDTHSIRTITHNGEEYKRGIFLFYTPSPAVLDSENPIEVTSVARLIVMDCSSGVFSPVAEFYFDVERLPLITDKPVRAFDYSGNTYQELITIPTSNPVYKTLCSKYL